MSEPPSSNPDLDLRRRLRELLSVPERERTDEQWDEIIELEVRLAPGNRLEPSRRADSGSGSQGQGRQQQAPKKHSGGPRPAKRPGKHQR
jgi:hypothetical protein